MATIDLTNITEKLREFDINDLDINNVGIWPAPIKIIAGCLLFSLVLAGGYWFYYQDLQNQYGTLQKKELTLKKSYETKARKASNLEAYKVQMTEMEASFGALLEQLPKDTEVPGLLEDITRAGSSSGLDFQSIRLESENVQEFYVELPIRIQASGPYHDIGSFVSGVANLPRIVTLHDFKISAATAGVLNLSITAKTYRYKERAGE
ncbi:MAG: type 4a pilus biogenesis protein PilO [Pseudomonadales bacterium]|nr:type 4a pilus biogenesis protein PilO [Pseudomonadales bacterium]